MPSYLAAVFAQSVFVKQVFGHAVLRSTHAAQVGHPVGQLFDGLDLLVQEMCLDKVAKLKKKEKTTESKTERLATNTAVWISRLCSKGGALRLFTTYMWVVVIGAQLVQVQEGLVHTLLKLQGTFEGLRSAAPLIPLRLLENKMGRGNGETPSD